MFSTWKIASPTVVFGALGTFSATVGVTTGSPWAAVGTAGCVALAVIFTDSPKTVKEKVEVAHQTPPDQPLP